MRALAYAVGGEGDRGGIALEMTRQIHNTRFRSRSGCSAPRGARLRQVYQETWVMAQQHVICVDNNMQIAMGAWCRACAACGARCGPPGELVLFRLPVLCFFKYSAVVSAAPCDMRFSVFLTSRYLFRPRTLPCPCSTLEALSSQYGNSRKAHRRSLRFCRLGRALCFL